MRRKHFFSVLAMLACSGAACAGAPGDAGLDATIAALDHQVFDAFNRCADPAQLARHAGYFDDAVEFYHDTGGVTWNRADMLANTQKNACGNYTRQLVADSLQVYAIKDFGALATGQHRFCDNAGGHCEGLAEFSMLWRLRDGRWQITRVLSFGHRPAAPTQAP